MICRVMRAGKFIYHRHAKENAGSNIDYKV